MAYPTAPPATWAPAPYRDPTDVMGRRIGAYLLGLLFASIITAGLSAAILFGAVRPWTHHTAPAGDARSTCTEYNSSNSGNNNTTCVALSDTDYYIVEDNPVIVTLWAVGAGWFIVDAVLIEGLAGGKIGKLLLGLRVVRHDGQPVGVPRALLRNIFLIIPDQFLVGLITALVTRGHKRVGDMVAGTYVVDRDTVGHEIVIDGSSSGQYTSPPSYGAPPTHPGAGTWGTPQQPGAGTWGTPQQPEPGTWGTPHPDAPARHAGAIRETPDWHQTPSTQPAPQTHEPAAPRREPVWDEARHTYLWWSDDQQEWLEHDPQSGQWRPLSR